MIIKINWIKQKLAGFALLATTLIFGVVFGFEGEIGFACLVVGVMSMTVMFTKERLFDHDYILYFDLDKFRGLR